MNCDVLIVGGGIAGLSLASVLAGRCSVMLVEAEAELAYHTSSRSARQMQPSYGPGPVKELTRRTIARVQGLKAAAGLDILSPRPLIFIGSGQQVAALTAANSFLAPLTHAEALRLSPDLAPGSFEAACLDGSALEVKVPELLGYYERQAVQAGAAIHRGSPVHTAQRTGAGWSVGAGQLGITAGTVVDAAGAWADPLAVLFGVENQGLQPHRRTAAIAATARPADPAGPMIAAADDSFYYRPDGTDLLISPCESVPSIAEDARPFPGDVEKLVARLNRVTTLGISGIRRAWTGLRTTPADGLPVVGFDQEAPGFFWLAGQGGYGIQTSAAMADLATGLILGESDGTDEVAAALAPRHR
ncbi:FAD-binding oxidoreductase [Paenarthrobacter sp. DKR-5]|uniref:NAD(P)/FAD-dependent oxidoreductase n=1 Tax=Paenarthrobacter sp. DKR-5 TaxID=2835535 RepID=UPI001BDCB25F|nr:FAD-dependent oxidoreductase [Paenarthrobacter sp. DKR-5]MBT1002591.1 FAD-binding oxidoreductase [Paenarthrobacter sp. DKR-5]